MRKIFTIAFLMLATLGISKETETAETPKTLPSLGDWKTKDVKNVVKLNIVSLAVWNNLALQYERALGKKTSAAFMLGIMPGRGLPSALVKQDDTGIAAQWRFSGYSLTPEFRFYPGKKGALKGFYLAPYLRMARYTMRIESYEYSYVDPSDNFTYRNKIELKGSYGGFGGGLMIGSQWLIAGRIALDWYIFGGHYGTGSIKFKGESKVPFSAEAKAELNEELSNMDTGVFNTEPKVTVTNTSAEYVQKTPYFGIRGFGVSIGYSF